MSEGLTVVGHYGLHRDPGIGHLWYLHQGNNGRGYNFAGLARESPFKVIPANRRVQCPHFINTNVAKPEQSQWDMFVQLYKDDLVRQCLPLPKESMFEKTAFLSDENGDLTMALLLLSKLASPLYPVVKEIDRLRLQQIEMELTSTNCCPLILTGVKTEHQRLIEDIAVLTLKYPRRVILSGDPRMIIRDQLQRIETHVHQMFETNELFTLPMESLGAVALRRFCRGEAIDGPWK